jgi:hypothetical protein
VQAGSGAHFESRVDWSPDFHFQRLLLFFQQFIAQLKVLDQSVFDSLFFAAGRIRSFVWFLFD